MSFGPKILSAFWFLLVAGFLSWSLPTSQAQAAIAFVQGNYATPQAPQTTVTVAFPLAQSTGNLNVVIVGWYGAGGTVNSVTDSRGNAYSLAVGPTTVGSGATSHAQAIYYARNIAAGSSVVTVSFSTAVEYPDIRVLEYSGLDPVNPLHAVATSTGTSATSSSGALNVTAANALLVAANTVSTSTSGPGTNFTSRMISSPNGDIAEDRIVTAAGSYTGTAPLTGSGEWVMQMVAFTPQPSGPAAPTITGVANQATAAGTAVGPIGFTVGDADTPLTSLTVTGTSSNPTLLPNANIVLGGSGASRTITLNPAPGQTGTATITLTVSDGALTATTNFQLAVNSFATFTAFPNSTTILSGTLASGSAASLASNDNVFFTVNSTTTGTRTAAWYGSFLGVAKNLSRLNINYSGNNSRSCTQTIALWNWTTSAWVQLDSRAVGTTEIAINNLAPTGTLGDYVSGTAGNGEVRVRIQCQSTANLSNRGDILSIGYDVPVATNTPPTISSVANQATTSGTAVGPLGLTVGDGETPAASLTLSGTSSNATLVPNANIVLGGSGASRTVTVTPAAGQTGTATITVTVNDGALTASTNFVLTVSAGNNAPTDIVLSNTAVAENQPSGTTVGTLSSTDPDAGNTFTYTLVAGTGSTDNASFQIAGNALRTNAAFDFETKNSYSVRVRSTDQGGLFFEKAFTITVTNVNEAPTITGIAAQTTTSGTAIGPLGFTVADVDTALASLTLSGASSNTTLVPNANIVFGGSGASRTVTVTPAAGQSGTATITVTVNDGALTASTNFVLTVSPGNTAPTDIALDNAAVAENQPSGTTVGTLTTTDPDAGNTFTYTLVAGTGSTDNASFQITGNALRTNAAFDFETKNSYSMRVRSTDQGGLFFEKAFTITVTDVNEAPTITAIAAQATTSGTAVGPLGFTVGDVDTPVAGLTVSGGSSNTTLVPNTNIVFGGSGASRTVTVTPAAGQTGTSTITVTVNDGVLTAITSFLVTVNAGNNAPTDIALDNTVIAENQPSGTTVGTLSSADPDAGNTFTYTLVAGTGSTDNASFQIAGNALRTNAAFDFETKNSYSVRVRSTDQGGLFFEKAFTIAVTNVNEAPTITGIAAQSTTSGTAVGPLGFTVADVDTALASLTVSGASSNTTLVPNANIVFGGSGASRTVTVTPAAGQSGTATITLTVSDGTLTANTGFVLTVSAPNTAPTITGISNQTTNVGTATAALGFTVGDAESAAASLTVSGASSNTTLVPNANIVFGGADANRTVTITPAAGQVGTATITITVNDGQLSALTTLQLTVSDLTRPTAPTNFVATVMSSSRIDLTWTASTDNVGVTGYIMEHSVGTVCCTWIPRGTASTTSFSDTGLAAGTTYKYWVRAMDAAGNVSAWSSIITAVTLPAATAPTITTISNQSTTSGTAVGPIVFTVDDVDTPVANLTVTGASSNTALVPNANIVLGGSGANRTVTVTPAAGQTGTATITLTVSDGALTASSSFALSVSGGTPATIAFVQGNYAVPQTPQATVTVNYPLAQSAGNLNVVIVGWYAFGPSVTSVTDSRGNAYSLAVGPTQAGSGATSQTQAIYFARDISAAPANGNIVTVTFSAPAEYPDIRVLEYSGIDKASPLVGAVGASGSSATSSSGALSLSTANALLVAGNTVSTSTGGPGASFTSRMITSPNGDIAQDRVVSATGNYTATAPLTGAGLWVMQMAAFKAAILGNQAPTITNIGNQVAVTGAAVGPIGFTVGDAETPAATLSVSGTSSNTTLLPSANIVFGGAGANRTVTLTPAAGQTGTATITVTVNDGVLSASTNFVLTVNPVGNTPPTITAIGNQTTTTGTAVGPVGFTIGDAETAAGSLAVSGASSNTTLVPNANIVLAGSGANRTVTLTPAAGQTGTANITITVSDGALTASRTFALTVNAPGNSAPTITAISNQSTATGGTPVGPINFTVGDLETAAGSLTVSGVSSNTTLMPNASIALGGTGANRTVTLTPVAGQTGTATITLTVSDGTLAASTSFLLTVGTGGAPAPISFVQGTYATPQAPQSTVAVTYPAAQSAGNLNVVVVGWYGTGPAVTSVSDTMGNAYSVAIGPTVAGSGTTSQTQAIYFAPNIASASANGNTVTVHFSTAAQYPDIRVLEYHGIDAQSPLVGVSAATGVIATSNSGAINVSAPRVLLLASNTVSSTTSFAGASYTNRMITSPNGSLVEDRVVSTPGSYTADATLTSGGDWVMQMAAFKAATLPPDSTPPTVAILSPAASATVTSIVNVVASASDNLGVASVQFYLDGAPLGSEILDPPYSVLWDTTTSALGSHVLTAIARDGSGNETTSVAVPVTVAAPTPSALGQWLPPANWPLVAVHANLLPTGDVLAWDGADQGGAAYLWRPSNNSFVSRPPPDNIFCAGHTVLSDGRLLVVGGHVQNFIGIPDANIFNSATSSWTQVASMAYGRWYPTAVALPDSRVLVVAGKEDCETCVASVPEIYNVALNTWTPLPGAVNPLPEYPHLFVLSNGRILQAGSFESAIPTQVLDINTQTWTTVDPVVRDGHSSVMYAQNKVMKSGTAATTFPPYVPSSAATYVLDMNQAQPAWRATAPMTYARSYHNLTILPGGSVLATGGVQSTDPFDQAGAVLPAELWSPVTETWSTLAPLTVRRVYHSIALLLPDARVLVAGGGRFGGGAQDDQLTAEIFSPPYLFNGPRPVITTAPSQVAYNSAYQVVTPDAARVANVSLLPLGSVTHHFNANQRYLSLPYQVVAGGISIQSPANANLAPPGYYMLFLVDTNGVPSVAAILKVQ